MAVMVLAIAQPAVAAPVCEHAEEIPTPDTLPEARRAMLCLINGARENAGAPIVHTVDPLRREAKRYARKMVAVGFFGHKAPDGTTLNARARDVGYIDDVSHAEVGETLSWARDTAATPLGMILAWLKSPTHKSVILDDRYRQVGIGVAYGVPGSVTSAAADTPSATYAVAFGVRSPR
jgi:uncharacterized protein YkwD